MKTKKIVCYKCGGHGFITSTYENGQTSAICPVCGGIGSHKIQMTNADKIRAMGDEELAKLLCCTGWRMFEQKECLEWLQQPSREEDKHEPN